MALLLLVSHRTRSYMLAHKAPLTTIATNGGSWSQRRNQPQQQQQKRMPLNKVDKFRGLSTLSASDDSIPAVNGRIPTNGVSLDVNLIASNQDLVMSHLTARRGSPQLMDDLKRMGELRSMRNALIVEGDTAKNLRKTLSAQIGQLMKEGKESEVAALKAQVEDANNRSAAAGEKQEKIDEEINRLFTLIPNLLDDR